MKKHELIQRVAATKSETKDAILLIYDTLNRGQQKKLVKNDQVKALFDRYGIDYEEE